MAVEDADASLETTADEAGNTERSGVVEDSGATETNVAESSEGADQALELAVEDAAVTHDSGDAGNAAEKDEPTETTAPVASESIAIGTSFLKRNPSFTFHFYVRSSIPFMVEQCATSFWV